jgi:hypothetical protein
MRAFGKAWEIMQEISSLALLACCSIIVIVVGLLLAALLLVAGVIETVFNLPMMIYRRFV